MFCLTTSTALFLHPQFLIFELLLLLTNSITVYFHQHTTVYFLFVAFSVFSLLSFFIFSIYFFSIFLSYSSFSSLLFLSLSLQPALSTYFTRKEQYFNCLRQNEHIKKTAKMNISECQTETLTSQNKNCVPVVALVFVPLQLSQCCTNKHIKQRHAFKGSNKML